MKDEDIKAVLDELRDIRMFMVSSDQVERVRILGNLLQNALIQNDQLAADMKALLGTVHHDLMWLRKHIAQLSKQIERLAGNERGS